MHTLKKHGLQILTHIASLVPLAMLAWDFAQVQLGVNPIEAIQLRTGKSALVLLVLSLACTPVSTIFGLKQVLPLCRPPGLYAFMYASPHFLNFIGLDYGFNFTLIREDISDKRFALAGLAAFLCLLPITVTSTQGWMKRLGRNWQRIHRLIYVAALLATLHFTWQVKADLREPLIYSTVVVLLLIVRIPGMRERVSRLRHRLKKAPTNSNEQKTK